MLLAVTENLQNGKGLRGKVRSSFGCVEFGDETPGGNYRNRPKMQNWMKGDKSGVDRQTCESLMYTEVQPCE